MARSSRAIKRKQDESAPGGWKGLTEQAPSLVRPEQPAAGRVIALAALFPLTLGGAAILTSVMGWRYLISPAWGVFLLVIGVAGILYHAFNEKDLQYRRLYGFLGAGLVGLGILFRLLPGSEGGLGGATFLPYGAPSLLLGLGFLLSFVRNETEAALRVFALNSLAIVGAGCALLGFVLGLFSETFLVGHGVVLLVLGLLYLASYVGMQDAGSDRAYWVGMGIGGLGGLMILVALGCSLLPDAMFALGWLEARPTATFFMPRGLLLLYLGLEYLMLSVGICSDAKLVVLTRRELASLFYSPIAYIVLIGTALVGWISFNSFVNLMWRVSERGQPIPEPIVQWVTFGLFPVLLVVFAVPLLTMRLLSEEYRTGSLEVLLTAPVNETAVVLSKFFAAWRVFLLAWFPWGLYLVALYVEADRPFDYRPLLTFMLVMAIMSAGWLAMGLFFSGLTRNQMVAAVLTLVMMFMFTSFHLILNAVQEGNPFWRSVLQYVSYIDLWLEASGGNVSPRFLLFYISSAVFWLFLTVKVLEARKWT